MNRRAGAVRPRPKRSLGQNFLVDANLQRKIVAAALDDAGGACAPGQPVLEIGPGRGALTDHLARRDVRLFALELDDILAAALSARYADNPRVAVVHGDVLGLELPSVTGDWPATRVVGNIPYNITTPIVFRLLAPPCPKQIVLTMQAEVADRMLAGPGSKTYGALSVGVALSARAERLFAVPRTAFRPVPRVDSAVVRLTPLPASRTDPADARLGASARSRASVRTLVRAAFSWRRKQMGTILTRHPDLRFEPAVAARALESRSLPKRIRPEQLSPEDFAALAEALPLHGRDRLAERDRHEVRGRHEPPDRHAPRR